MGECTQQTQSRSNADLTLHSDAVKKRVPCFLVENLINTLKFLIQKEVSRNNLYCIVFIDLKLIIMVVLMKNKVFYSIGINS